MGPSGFHTAWGKVAELDPGYYWNSEGPKRYPTVVYGADKQTAFGEYTSIAEQKWLIKALRALIFHRTGRWL